MAEDVKADELFEQLRDSFNTRIRKAVADLPAHQALQLADALCHVQLEVLAGMRVRYKAKQTVDADAITEAWRQGRSLDEIRRDFKISRTTAYKYHPSTGALRNQSR